MKLVYTVKYKVSAARIAFLASLLLISIFLSSFDYKWTSRLFQLIFVFASFRTFLFYKKQIAEIECDEDHVKFFDHKRNLISSGNIGGYSFYKIGEEKLELQIKRKSYFLSLQQDDVVNFYDHIKSYITLKDREKLGLSGWGDLLYLIKSMVE